MRHDGSLTSRTAVAKVPEQTVRWVDLEGHLAGISTVFLVLTLILLDPYSAGTPPLEPYAK